MAGVGWGGAGATLGEESWRSDSRCPADKRWCETVDRHEDRRAGHSTRTHAGRRTGEQRRSQCGLARGRDHEEDPPNTPPARREEGLSQIWPVPQGSGKGISKSRSG